MSPRLILLPLLAASLVGCSDTGLVYNKDEPVVVAPGTITGRVCDPSGRTWLSDALAYVNLVDDNGVIYDTRRAYSDLDGNWTLDDLPGEHEYELYVTYGTEVLEQETIYVGDGETIQLEEPDCFDPLALKVAVVTGSYDDFDRVLDDMGFANYELIDGESTDTLIDFLTNFDAMQKYDIIFFNGGMAEEGVIYDTKDDTNPVPGEVIANLQAYVQAGGSTYWSDWSYDGVERAWPDRIEFVGADEVPDDAQKGEYASVSAAIADASLSEFLDADYTTIEYDLPVWPPIENVSSSVSVHLTGSVPYSDGLSEYTLSGVPLLVSFNDGGGKVVFSTFRVVRNGGPDMINVLQYMMYNL